MGSVRTIPCSLVNTIRDKNYIPIIKEAVHKYNNIVILSLQLFNLYSIKKFQENDKTALQNIDRLLIRRCLMISSGKCDANENNFENVELTSELKGLFSHIENFCNPDWIVRETWMNQLNKYYDSTLYTNVTVNIKERFKSRVNKFVNRTFEEELESFVTSNSPTKENRKQKIKILSLIKKDLFENTRDSPEHFHKWIDEHRPEIFPEIKGEKGIDYDIQVNPFNYYYGTLYIAGKLEQIENIKLFKAVPLRTSLISHFIRLDGEILAYMFSELFVYKTSVMAKKENKRKMFSLVFNLKKEEFKNKLGMKFDYMIQTDGISCRLVFKTHEKIQHEKINGKQRTKNKQVTEKQERKERKNKEEYKYLDRLSKKTKKSLQDKIIIGIDPGKSDLFTASYKYENKIHNFSFSSKTKRHLDYTNRRVQITNWIEKENKIFGVRNDFATAVESGRHRYSMDMYKFVYYLHRYHLYAKQVEHLYMEDIWKKLEWRSFIRKQQTKELILEEFTKNLPEKVFQNNKIQNVVLGMGDWSSKNKTHLKNNKPTLGLGLLRLLSKKFEHMYLIDEYNTSRKCNNCHQSCENEIYTKKVVGYTKSNTTINRKVHKILCCTNNNCRTLWNRDINGSGNIRLKSECILLNQEIPEGLQRVGNQTSPSS